MVVSPTVCLADGFFNLHCSNWAILRAENNANVCPSFWVIVRTSIRPAAFGVDYAAIRDRLQSVELHHLVVREENAVHLEVAHHLIQIGVDVLSLLVSECFNHTHLE